MLKRKEKGEEDEEEEEEEEEDEEEEEQEEEEDKEQLLDVRLCVMTEYGDSSFSRTKASTRDASTLSHAATRGRNKMAQGTGETARHALLTHTRAQNFTGGRDLMVRLLARNRYPPHGYV